MAPHRQAATLAEGHALRAKGFAYERVVRTLYDQGIRSASGKPPHGRKRSEGAQGQALEAHVPGGGNLINQSAFHAASSKEYRSAERTPEDPCDEQS